MATADNVNSGAGQRGRWALLPVALALVVLFETVTQQSGLSAGLWVANLAMAVLMLALPVVLALLLIRALR